MLPIITTALMIFTGAGIMLFRRAIFSKQQPVDLERGILRAAMGHAGYAVLIGGMILGTAVVTEAITAKVDPLALAFGLALLAAFATHTGREFYRTLVVADAELERSKGRSVLHQPPYIGRVLWALSYVGPMMFVAGLGVIYT